jgi:hypothetical protein
VSPLREREPMSKKREWCSYGGKVIKELSYKGEVFRPRNRVRRCPKCGRRVKEKLVFEDHGWTVKFPRHKAKG